MKKDYSQNVPAVWRTDKKKNQAEKSTKEF